MNNIIKQLINSSVSNILSKSASTSKINAIELKHSKKIHFIPKRFRIFGGILQSMNIQFGNFIEELMAQIIAQDDKYEIIKELSGKKSNQFTLSVTNEKAIDDYIIKCQSINSFPIENEFPRLANFLLKNNSSNINYFKHDIDLLFKEKSTGIIYYLEIKYNDDHDTGKFVDINRKFIKTYAYLMNSLKINQIDELVPILFFFTNKKLKGNIYIPESTNIKRGKGFFDQFLQIKYDDIDRYILNLSEDKDIIKMYDNLYEKITKKD